MTLALSRLPRLARTLGRDRKGLALIEFALTLPIILTLGGWGIELSSFALSNLRVSQYALNLADNASRIGTRAGAVQQLREADINDVLQGTRLESAGIGLTTNGRVTLSSLENVRQSYDSQRVSRIHWQRCIGVKSGTDYDPRYGTTTTNAGTTDTAADAGTPKADMGETGQKVTAIDDGGVMFVEVGYQYKPLFGNMFMNPQVIRYTASFMVRDNRDFSRIYNPTPAITTANLSTCDKHAI